MAVRLLRSPGVRTRVRDWWVVVLVSAASAAAILGPALGRGVVLTYDMAWSPDARWTPFSLGTATPAPRAVPSDAVAVAMGKLVGAETAQHLILFGILFGLAVGAVALLRWLVPHAGTVARCATAIAAVWNPFVSERLVVGQWVVLLGLAVLPWAMRAALGVTRGTATAAAPSAAVAVSALGGANSLLIVSISTLLLLTPGALFQRSRRSWTAVVGCVAVTMGGAACWALPAIANSPRVTTSSVRAFAPTSDTPLGVVGSLLAGGGFWNPATHPEARASWVNALAATTLCLVAVVATVRHVRGTTRMQCTVLVAVMTGVTLASALTITSPLWQWVVTTVPGAGALRDSQKFMAPWMVLAAVGVGVLVARMTAGPAPALAAPTAAVLMLLPLALSPQLVWGVGGRVAAVQVPDAYRAGMSALSVLPPGDVGLLPWSQYRRYGWNDRRVSLTLVPRMADQVITYNDALPLRGGTVQGESPRAAAISEQVAAGARSEDVVAASGVTYVLAELEAGGDVDLDRLKGHGTVLIENAHLVLIEVTGGSSTTHRITPHQRAGWVTAGITLLAATFWFVRRRSDGSYL